MADHYYTSQPHAKSDPQTWQWMLKGKTFTFTTDNGVFSKREVDFGSQVLIEHVTVPDISGDVIDVGCGYGPIGLACAKEESTRTVHMVDVNERALALAKENAAHNHINNVKIYKSNLFENVSDHSFACVISNPPIRAGKAVVHQLFDDAYEHLVQSGELWIVIQKKQGASSALKKLESLFNEVEVVAKKKGYYIIRSKKC